MSDTDPGSETTETAANGGPPVTPLPRRGRKVRRGPILFVVLAALIAALVVQQHASSTTGSTAPRVVLDGASVPPADAASTAWYCAEGTSSPDGRADETVIVASLADARIDVTITVMSAGDSTPATRKLRLAPREETRVHVSDILATPEPGVVVEAVGGRAVVSHQLVHGGDFAVEPCTRTASSDSYFAAGTTVDGTEHYLAIFNPYGDDAIVDVGFVTDAGVQQPDGLQALVIPRRSRVTVAVQDYVPRQDRVAARVHARVGRVVTERTQIFDGTVPAAGPTREGIAVSLGAPAPTEEWRIPAGTTANGGTASVALANFTGTDASVQVHVVLVGNLTLSPQTVAVPSHGVAALDVTARVPLDTPYSLVVTSRAVNGRPVPVVAELLASWAPSSTTTGVATALGTTVTARRWVIPQPDVDAEAFLTVMNPGGQPVTAALLPAASVDRRTGPTSEPELAIPPGRAKVLDVVLVARDPGGAFVVTANHPIVVGLTVLGNAGASLSPAIPDLSYGG
ncbi:MAG: hypothetical protein QOF40_3520 [Actinomycetota bacterium]|nr:hypothetical protein [Actinomycetota bacterium]